MALASYSNMAKLLMRIELPWDICTTRRRVAASHWMLTAQHLFVHSISIEQSGFLMRRLCVHVHVPHDRHVRRGLRRVLQ